MLNSDLSVVKTTEIQKTSVFCFVFLFFLIKQQLSFLAWLPSSVASVIAFLGCDALMKLELVLLDPNLPLWVACKMVPIPTVSWIYFITEQRESCAIMVPVHFDWAAGWGRGGDCDRKLKPKIAKTQKGRRCQLLVGQPAKWVSLCGSRAFIFEVESVELIMGPYPWYTIGLCFIIALKGHPGAKKTKTKQIMLCLYSQSGCYRNENDKCLLGANTFFSVAKWNYGMDSSEQENIASFVPWLYVSQTKIKGLQE